MTLPRRLLLAFTLVLVLGSCTRSGEKPDRKSPTEQDTPPTLQNAIGVKLIPAVDGGVYAIDRFGGGVWYVRGAKAERLIGLEVALISSIVPAVDGGIYLHVLDDKKSGLWYLKGTTVSKSRGTPSDISLNDSNRGYYFRTLAMDYVAVGAASEGRS